MKREIRRRMLFLRENIDKEKLMKWNENIYNKIVNWDVFKDAKMVMIYASFKNEVKTWDIIDYCFEKRKDVILPKTIKDGFKILPCKINSLDELSRTSFGILEPSGENVVDKDKIDMIIVPGIAFDRNGNRIGYGAGYYDRFLKDCKGIKAGVCYSIQMVEDVYADEHDVKMDYLITERGIIYTGDN